MTQPTPLANSATTMYWLLKAQKSTKVFWDDQAEASFLYSSAHSEGHFVSYEGQRSLQNKARLCETE